MMCNTQLSHLYKAIMLIYSTLSLPNTLEVVTCRGWQLVMTVATVNHMIDSDSFYTIYNTCMPW